MTHQDITDNFLSKEFKHWSSKASAFVHIPDSAKQEIITYFQSAYTPLIEEAVKAERERLVKEIERRKSIVPWKHTKGSHSDDHGGDNDLPCNCRDEEIKWVTDTYDSVLSLLTNPKSQ